MGSLGLRDLTVNAGQDRTVVKSGHAHEIDPRV